MGSQCQIGNYRNASLCMFVSMKMSFEFKASTK